MHDKPKIILDDLSDRGTTVRLVNAVGAVLYKWNGKAVNDSRLDINMNGMAPGMYSLEVLGNDGYRSTEKIMKL